MRAGSEHVGHETLALVRGAFVALVALPRRKGERRRRLVLVGDARQEVRDRVEPRAALVVGFHGPPGGQVGVGVGDGVIPGDSVGVGIGGFVAVAVAVGVAVAVAVGVAVAVAVDVAVGEAVGLGVGVGSVGTLNA